MPRSALKSITPEAIREASQRLVGRVQRTPLIRLHLEDSAAEIYLKLENLQPIGSFKLRGAASAMSLASPEQLARGVYTASAGNMAQGVAWIARQLAVPCTVLVPDNAPEIKLSAIERLGGKLIKIPRDTWWQVLIEHRFAGQDGFFVHPVCDPAVIAGNASIGLEILEELPDVDSILVPFGGGGLIAGIASAVQQRSPRVRILAAEVAQAAPLSAALAAGRPVPVPFEKSFVDGIGAVSVLDEMWPLLRDLVDDSLVVSLDAICTTIRLLLARAHVLAEGAGAASVAAALSGRAGSGKLVCIVSGGNLDASKLERILAGGIPD